MSVKKREAQLWEKERETQINESGVCLQSGQG